MRKCPFAPPRARHYPCTQPVAQRARCRRVSAMAMLRRSAVVRILSLGSPPPALQRGGEGLGVGGADSPQATSESKAPRPFPPPPTPPHRAQERAGGGELRSICGQVFSLPRATILSGLLLLASLAHPAAAADTVKVGIARTVSDAGYYIAEAEGLFRQEGIEMALTPFNSAAQMIAPLGTGELDVGGGTVSAGFYNAVGRGIAMKIVADQASMKPGYGYSSLMVRKDLVDSGRYKSFADLKGMKVAIAAPGTGTASALNETLKQGGLKYGDVEVVYLG